ncbi:MAG TPA: hypothetical protein VL485_03035 [Ktedonobacteraceae bacterium]|nr:hypothetical protein [Ktedonobacteraceae bacterium]
MVTILKAALLPLGIVVSIPIIWRGNHLGLWWITIIIGFCFGLFVKKSRITFGSAALAALGGWGLDLLWQARTSNIGGAANVMAGIIGIGTANGYLIILFTLFFAMFLCFTGAWFATALVQIRNVVIAGRADVHPTSTPESGNAAESAKKTVLLEEQKT